MISSRLSVKAPWADVVANSLHEARTPVLTFLAKTGFTLAHFGNAMRTCTTLMRDVAPLRRVGRGGGNELLSLVGGLKTAHVGLLRVRGQYGGNTPLAPTWDRYYAEVMEPVFRRKTLPQPFSWERVGRDQWRVVEAYDSEHETSALFKAADAANDGTSWTLKPSHPLLRTALGSVGDVKGKVLREGQIHQKPGTAEYRIEVVAKAALHRAQCPEHRVMPVEGLKATLHGLVSPLAPSIATSAVRRVQTVAGKPTYCETVEMLVRLG